MKRPSFRRKKRAVRVNEGKMAFETGDDKGTITLNTQMLQLPENFINEHKPSDHREHDPIIIAFFAVATIFIIFIAFLISRMPPK